MSKSLTYLAFTASFVLILSSCLGPTEQSLTEVKNDSFKTEIRSQEFGHSIIHNVDICVADASGQGFPTDSNQCFLHGFDFSGLSAKWLSERNVEISFNCGKVVRFSNFA